MWNFNSLSARGFSRIPIVESLQVVHKFDIFTVCESSLNEPNNISMYGFSSDPFRVHKPAHYMNFSRKTYLMRFVVLHVCMYVFLILIRFV